MLLASCTDTTSVASMLATDSAPDEGVLGSGGSAGSAGTGGSDGSGASGDAGLTDAPFDSPNNCNELIDDGAAFTASCPTGSSSCPTAPACGAMRCADCADAGWGAPIPDGLYELSHMVVWISACGSLNMTPVHGTLRVAGSTMDLRWTRPFTFGPAITSSSTFNFRIEGRELVLEQTCPATSSPETRVRYTLGNGRLYFPDSFPNPEAVELTFTMH